MGEAIRDSLSLYRLSKKILRRQVRVGMFHLTRAFLFCLESSAPEKSVQALRGGSSMAVRV